MNAISLRASDIFNMSFGQVFVAGSLEGESALIGPSRWKLLINNQEIAELEAIGEQLPKGARSGQRVVSYKGQIDTSALNLASDNVILVKVEELL
jgi:hypothetical protein